MLRVVCRSYGGENRKGRPDYYSKLLALASLVRAFRQLDGQAELIFLNDGPIPSDRLRLMEQSGEVLARAGLGLLGSLRGGLALATSRGWSDDDLVWFSEDDYLYLPHALRDLIAAAGAYPDASYFGLYALIGSRLPDGSRFEEERRVPKRWQGTEVAPVNGHPWRKALSTTSTFGARVGALVEDRAMMELVMRTGGSFDHSTCLVYQGFTPYSAGSLIRSFRHPDAPASWSRRMGILSARAGLDIYQAVRARTHARRLLVAADPALITHLETRYLALGTDWASVAQDTREWAEAEVAGLRPQPGTPVLG